VNFIFPIAFFDPPQVLSASATNIPGSGSSPLQVIANIGPKAAFAIDYIDSTGDYIGVYIGASGFETFGCVIGGGLNTRAWLVIPAQSRVSLRSMSATPITSGQLMCAFVGV
jgi:hypothetical protein